jgi:hypothetical protein
MFDNTVVKKISVSVLSILSIMFSCLFLFLGTSEGTIYDLALSTFDTTTMVVSWIVLGCSAVSILLFLFAGILQFTKKNVKSILLSGSIFSIVSMVLSISNEDIHILYPILAVVCSLLVSIYATIYEIHNKEDGEEENKNTTGNIFSVSLSILSLILLFSIFLIPVCFFDETPYFFLLSALGDNATLECLISFGAFFALYILILLYFTQSLIYLRNTNKFLEKTRLLLYYEFALSIAFFVFSVVISFIDRTSQGYSVSKVLTISYIPLLVLAILAIINSIVSSRYLILEENSKHDQTLLLKNRIVALAFVLLFLGLLVGALFSNILVIRYGSTGSTITNVVTVNGFEVLTNYQNMEAGYKTLAFFIYMLLVYAICMTVVSLSLFFRKSVYFYKFSFVTVCISFVLLITLSMFGKYYEIGEGISNDTITKLLEAKGVTVSTSYESKVTSQTIYFALAGLALMCFMIALKPFSNKVREEALDVNINNDLSKLNPATLPSSPVEEAVEEEPLGSKEEEPKLSDFDPCPAFSMIDSKKEEYLKENEQRGNAMFGDVSLSKIVSFVVDYARDSRLHLSYRKEDIAQFVAGLGSSRLSILQGMSGTGKTSLPKIFCEALFGNCEIIEVESSWKDRNELIGYYNVFSGLFTPKKFTQALYKAKFNQDVITLIVLDEMNLSRIEYYFSDFLSLMENEEDKRQIDLLNVPLHIVKDGKEMNYENLVDGHILKIPTNIWFIGTANRDESTFEISDKVYDRAMTMNFNKRAGKVRDYQDPMDRKYLTYSAFHNLIREAKNTYHFDCEENETVKAVEKILSPFNISFGNRILNQMESFVSVYCSCFEDPQSKENEALETILLSKVVQKLESKSIENKEELVHAFEGINLLKCAQFVSKLNEDI